MNEAHDPARAQRPFDVSSRDIRSIAIPACLASVTEPLAGMVHTGVIGQIGDAALLAGISLGAVAFNILLSLAVVLRFGTAGLTAQAVGAHDPLEGLLPLVRALVVALALGAIVLLVQAPLRAAFVQVLAPPGESLAAFSAYFHLRIWSVPLVLINLSILGWLYGRAKARSGLALQLVVNLINVVLAVLLVSFAGMGVEGVALAKICGEAVALMLGLRLVLRHGGGIVALRRALPVPDVLAPRPMRGVLALGRDLVIRSVALNLAFAAFSAQAARQGEATLAATGILLQIAGFAACFLDGIATAVEQLSGRAVGANWRPAFTRAVRLGLIWGTILALGLALALGLGGGALIDLLTRSQDVRDIARDWLPMMVLMPLVGMAAYVFDGVMIGATLNREMRDGMLMSVAIFLALLLALQPVIGLAGAWIALLSMLAARATIYAVAIRRRARYIFATTT